MIPKHKGGKFISNNRIKLCRPCEQFLHFMFTNAQLKKHFDTKEKISKDPIMLKFTEFIRETEYVKPKFRRTILKDFIKYLIVGKHDK